MTMGVRCRVDGVSWAVLAVLLVWTPRSAASEPEEPILVDYTAASGCESRDEFLRDITRRTSRARLGDVPEGARRFEVTIALANGVYAARVIVHGADGSQSSRSLSTEACAQATQALALIVALSIDPHAHAPAEPSSPGSGAPPRSPEDEAPLAAPPPTPHLADERARPLAEAPAERPVGSPVPSRMSAGADVEGILMIESHPSLALGAHVELERPHGPSLRASFRRTLPATVSSDSLGGRFTWTWARLDGCPFRVGGPIDVRPCLLGEVGEIDVAGVGGTSTTRRGRPWATVGLLVRVGAHPGPVVISTDFGLAAPINRESFVFVPSPEVYRIPPWIAFAGIALSGAWTL